MLKCQALGAHDEVLEIVVCQYVHNIEMNSITRGVKQLKAELQYHLSSDSQPGYFCSW